MLLQKNNHKPQGIFKSLPAMSSMTKILKQMPLYKKMFGALLFM